jgi:competence protein ComEC
VTELLRLQCPHVLLGSLCAGLAAANAARPGSWLAGCAALAAVASAGARPELRVPLLATALLATGWWWGAGRLNELDRSALSPHVDEVARAVVVVTAPPRHGTYSIRAPADVRRFGSLEVRERVLLELPPGRAPPQGAILELIGGLELPPTADSGFDERAWLRHQGIAVVLDGKVWRQVGRRGGLGGVADRLRRHIERTLASGTEGERGAVLAGVVLGADEGLTSELRDDFRASGLYHLLAVSGQNVVFIAIGVLAAAWLIGIPRWLGELGVLGAIVAYMLAVGWQPSVVRAGIAGGLASLAWLTARQRDRWYALLLGAMVLMAWNPYALLDPGFELSFVAVSAIFVAVPRLERALEGYPVPRKLGLIVAVSTTCGLATAPILWLRFGAVPLYSVPANAMAELSVGPMLGLGLVSSILQPVVPNAAAAIAWLAGWLAAYLAVCARLWASLPGAQITSGKVLAGTVLALALGAVLWRRAATPSRAPARAGR